MLVFIIVGLLKNILLGHRAMEKILLMPITNKNTSDAKMNNVRRAHSPQSYGNCTYHREASRHERGHSGVKQTTWHKGIKKIVKEKSLRGNLEMLRIQKYHSAKQYRQLSQVTKTSSPIQGLGRWEQAVENIH